MKKIVAGLLLAGCAHMQAQTPVEDLDPKDLYICRVSPRQAGELECITLEEYLEALKVTPSTL